MGDRSKIEWTDASWTPIRARTRAGVKGWHCEHVSDGCRNCYAESMNARLGTGFDFKPGNRARVELFLDEKMLLKPLEWKRPRMVFVCSMTDLFADFVPDEWIDRVFAVMALCPQHTFQVLTKRPARMRDYFGDVSAEGDRVREIAIDAACATKILEPAFPHEGRLERERRLWNAGFGGCKAGLPLPNVWLGVSAERQAEADQRIPDLLNTPAAVRFLSAEPLLGPIDLTRLCLAPGRGNLSPVWLDAVNGTFPTSGLPYIGDWDVDGPYPEGAPTLRLNWVIVGGESGREARPMHPDWARSIRDQCAAAGVAFFFKQWGEFAPGRITLGVFQTPKPERLGELVVGPDGIFRAFGDADEFLVMRRVGKKAAGRLLDGREWNETPAGAGARRAPELAEAGP